MEHDYHFHSWFLLKSVTFYHHTCNIMFHVREKFTKQKQKNEIHHDNAEVSNISEESFT